MLHPSSFTAYAFTEKNTPLKKLSIPWADPEQNQVVLKVKACGVCAGDTVPQLQAWPVALPRIPGHEFVGEIVAVGENETKFNIGEIVGGGWHAGHCSDCAQCRVGKFIGCTSRMAHGITHDGGYAEYVTIRREAVCRIPEGMAPEIAGPLLCAGVTMYNSLRNVDVRAGDIVAIHGIGGLGHLGIQFAAKMGYRAVALSSGPAKREDCMSFGAFAYLDASEVDQSAELQKMGGAKVLMLCAPTANVSGFVVILLLRY
ncbi:hypothetical protein EUX98_g825 [Antrodiella citrinella]|uniref:Alcohol dehydrogenase-like N-terminal domain-containing protein n=1 Tax=Antrodiella citrinella TaxID=2447956 RepID=A0A4V3XJJ8_9APHY|nr:hypothetical protein EUX98_g825 [Antrodiella citrinella]